MADLKSLSALTFGLVVRAKNIDRMEHGRASASDILREIDDTERALAVLRARYETHTGD